MMDALVFELHCKVFYSRDSKLSYNKSSQAIPALSSFVA